MGNRHVTAVAIGIVHGLFHHLPSGEDLLQFDLPKKNVAKRLSISVRCLAPEPAIHTRLGDLAEQLSSGLHVRHGLHRHRAIGVGGGQIST